MEHIDELKREAEEAKERVKKDIKEVREILQKIAEEAREMGKVKVEETVQRAERRIDETVQRVESRIDRTMAAVTKPSVVEPSSSVGSVVTEEMDFGNFTNVEVGPAFKVEINRSDSYGVTITASKKLFDYIDVAQSGNTLKISLKPLDFRFQLRPTLEARIAMPTLNKLRLDGAVRGTVSGFGSQEDFNLNLSGASHLDIDMEAGESKFEISGASRLRGNLKVGDAEFTLSGASRVALSGLANKVVLNAWGSSRLDLANFVLNDTDVHLKGASQVEMNVNGKMDLDLCGASKLNYIGNPTLCDINVSGASRLSHR